MRWGAVTSADPNRYQAPFWSGVNVEAYQLEPLRRALESPRTNLLLADDVGLGKTIEAGLVIQELLLRHRARTAVVVCPPSLSLKWQDEMRDKFGLDFTIVNSELMAQVRRTHGLHANPFLHVSSGDRFHGVGAPGPSPASLARCVRTGEQSQVGEAVRVRHPGRGRGSPRRPVKPPGHLRRPGLCGGHPAHRRRASARGQMRAPPVLVGDASQWTSRIVHRAAWR